jgi:hypothetical protein
MPKAMPIPATPQHKMWLGYLVLLVGILYLIQDYAPASMDWWKVSVWPTAVFVLLGVALVLKGSKK